MDAASAGALFEFSAGEQAEIHDGELESIGLFTKAAVETFVVHGDQALAPEVQHVSIARRLPSVPTGNPPYRAPYWPEGEAPCPPGAVDNGYLPDDGFCISPPWSTWADQAFVDGFVPSTLGLETYNWSAIATTPVGSHNLASALQTVTGEGAYSFEIDAVSPAVWRVVIAPGDPYRRNPPLRGTLVFPLFDSVGLLRDKEADAWKGERNGPMSSHVESPDLEWKFGGRSTFVLAKPKRLGRCEPMREFVTLPESVAQLAVPIVSVYKAATWKPLAEDFLLRVGPRETTVDLRAVCIFMPCTDDQLKAVAAAMGNAALRP